MEKFDNLFGASLVQHHIPANRGSAERRNQAESAGRINSDDKCYVLS
jgi:hypothetical protein